MDGSGIVAEGGGKLGYTTNNVAEYEGLIRGLNKGLELGIKNIIVKSDSELMVRQINGKYKVKAPQLKPLHEKALQILSRFKSHHVLHVPREENSLADRLANRALDSNH